MRPNTDPVDAPPGEDVGLVGVEGLGVGLDRPLAAVGQGHYPWLPVGLFLRHRMNPAADLRASRVPVALIVAGLDTLIPPARAAALAEAVPNLVFNRTIEGADHNDIYQLSAFQQAMDEALAAIERAGKALPQK